MSRGRRFIAQVLLLLGLIALSGDDGLFVAVVSVAVVAALPVNITVAAILNWTARQAPEIDSLRDAADNSITLSLQSAAAASLGLLTFLPREVRVAVGGHLVLVALAYIVLLNAVPAVGWLGTWRHVWLPRLRGRS